MFATLGSSTLPVLLIACSRSSEPPLLAAEAVAVRWCLANLRSRRARNPGNFDPVVEATDPQHLLLLAEGIGNGDHLHVAWEKHRGKARHGMLIGNIASPKNDVDRGDYMPAVGLGDPVRRRRRVWSELGHHSLPLAHTILRLGRAELKCGTSQESGQDASKPRSFHELGHRKSPVHVGSARFTCMCNCTDRRKKRSPFGVQF